MNDSNPLAYEPAVIGAMQSAIDSVLAPSLGSMTDERTAVAVLDALERQGLVVDQPVPDGFAAIADQVMDTRDAVVHVNIDMAAILAYSGTQVGSMIEVLQSKGLIDPKRS